MRRRAIVPLLALALGGAGANACARTGTDEPAKAPILASAALPERVRVTVLRDAGAAAGEGARWEAMLRTLGADVRLQAMNELRTDSLGLLVVPSARCASEAERELVRAATASGQGVVVAAGGAADSASVTCSAALGWQRDLVAAGGVTTVEGRGATHAAFPSGGPLTLEVPPGARLDLRPGAGIALRHPVRDAYWSDDVLNPAPPSGQPLLDAALTHGTTGAARVAWMGFALGDIADAPRQRALASLVVRNAVAWAAGVPQAEVEPWPAGRRAASVIAVDGGDDFAGLGRLAASLGAAGARITYFVDPSRPGADAARTMARGTNEVGLVATPNDAARSLGTLATAAGRRPRGLHPPDDRASPAALAAWSRAGGSYVLAAGDASTASPELRRAGGGTVVLLPRVVNDDSAAARAAGNDPQRMTRDLLDALSKIRALGGLYVLGLHAPLSGRREMSAVAASVARALVTDTSVWQATASEIADWWRVRGTLRVTVRRTMPHVLRVEVVNAARQPVDGATVRVLLSPGERIVSVSGAHRLPAAPGEVRFIADSLNAGETRAVLLALDGGRR